MRGAMLLMFFLLPLSAGCGQGTAPTTTVPLVEIAPPLIEAAQKKLPDVKFQNARKIQLNGQDAFEIRGTLPNGKIREVKVSASGEVIEVD